MSAAEMQAGDFGRAGQGVVTFHAEHHGQGKRLATLQALFALRGYALHQLADSTLLVERWGYCRPVADVDDAAQVLAQLGGAPASWVGHG